MVKQPFFKKKKVDWPSYLIFCNKRTKNPYNCQRNCYDTRPPNYKGAKITEDKSLPAYNV